MPPASNEPVSRLVLLVSSNGRYPLERPVAAAKENFSVPSSARLFIIPVRRSPRRRWPLA